MSRGESGPQRALCRWLREEAYWHPGSPWDVLDDSGIALDPQPSWAGAWHIPQCATWGDVRERVYGARDLLRGDDANLWRQLLSLERFGRIEIRWVRQYVSAVEFLAMTPAERRRKVYSREFRIVRYTPLIATRLQ